MKILTKLFLFIIIQICWKLIKTIESVEEGKPKNNSNTNRTRPQNSILFVIAYDGFQNEYLQRGVTPNLINFRRNGVYSDYMCTVYPALAISSFHSIATGRYPHNLEIKGRYTYIYKNNTLSAYGRRLYNVTQQLPIWTLNEMNGGQSICMMWPGSEYTYNNTNCTYVQKLDKNMTLKTRADTVINWLNVDKNRPNLVMFYVEKLDYIAHMTGPLSRNTTFMIKKLDLLTKYILRRLKEIKVYDITNIIILSDHGMLPILPKNLLKPEDSLILYNDSNIGYINDDVNLQFFARFHNKNGENLFPNNTRYLHEKFRKGKFQRLVRVPHPITNNSIVELQVDPGYSFLTFFERRSKRIWPAEYSVLLANNTNSVYGVHGYLRQNDGIFMAKGPLFVRYKKVEPFQMVDFYSAFAKILRIVGDYEKDGKFSRIQPIFTVPRTMSWLTTIVFIAALSVFATIMFYVIISYVVIEDAEEEEVVEDS